MLGGTLSDCGRLVQEIVSPIWAGFSDISLLSHCPAVMCLSLSATGANLPTSATRCQGLIYCLGEVDLLYIVAHSTTVLVLGFLALSYWKRAQPSFIL